MIKFFLYKLQYYFQGYSKKEQKVRRCHHFCPNCEYFDICVHQTTQMKIWDDIEKSKEMNK